MEIDFENFVGERVKRNRSSEENKPLLTNKIYQKPYAKMDLIRLGKFYQFPTHKFRSQNIQNRPNLR